MTTIWELAASQHGAFTTLQWDAHGESPASLRTALDHGHVRRAHRGAYVVAGAPPTWEQRLHVAVLTAGSDTGAGHRSAAALHAYPGFPRLPVEVIRPRGGSRRGVPATLRESLDLRPEDFTVIDGIRTTTALRTLIDIARIVHPLRLDRLVDAGLARKLFELEPLRERARAMARSGRKGTVSLRAALERRKPGHVALESELEAELFNLLDARGMPLPTRQRTVGGNRAPAGRVDFVYLDQRLVVEADSRTHHSQLTDWEADRERDLQLLAAGWRIVRVTWWQIKERPRLVVDAITNALAVSDALVVAQQPQVPPKRGV